MRPYDFIADVLGHYSPANWVVLASGAILLGVSRTGIRGSAFATVPLYAAILGTRESVGTVLVLVLAGDIVAAKYYFHHVDWSHVRRLAPGAAIGIVAAGVAGAYFTATAYARVIAGIVLASLVLILWSGRPRGPGARRSPTLVAPISVLGGAASMLGNLAGPVFNTYLVATGLPKVSFIATSAWFFFLMNVAKLPFHLFVWNSITTHALVVDLILLIPVLVGAFVGIWVARVVPERLFKAIILIVAATAAIRLFFL